MPILEKIFGEEQTTEILAKVCIKVARIPAFKLTLISLQSTSEEVKKLLTANTEEALAEGSFGLPWYVGEYLSSGKAWQ